MTQKNGERHVCFPDSNPGYNTNLFLRVAGVCDFKNTKMKVSALQFHTRTLHFLLPQPITYVGTLFSCLVSHFHRPWCWRILASLSATEGGRQVMWEYCGTCFCSCFGSCRKCIYIPLGARLWRYSNTIGSPAFVLTISSNRADMQVLRRIEFY